MRRLGPLILLFALVAAACSSAGGQTASSTTSTTASPAPRAPTTTAAPTTTTVPLPPVPAPAGDVRALTTKTGVVVPVEAAAAGGFQVRTPCGNTAVLNGTPVSSVMVVLDAGHGGDERGAVAPSGLMEETVNLAVVQAAKAALEAAHVSVALTRTGNYRVTLDTRTEIVNRLRPLAFVSVHHNSDPDGPHAGPGTETYFQIASPESKRLAGLIYEEVVRALSQYNVAWVGDTDAGAKWRPNSKGGDYYAVLRKTAGVPSALAELAFVTNPPEAELLARPDVQQVEGAAVARGIVRYLTTKDPGSGFVTPYPRTEPAGGGGGSQGCADPPL